MTQRVFEFDVTLMGAPEPVWRRVRVPCAGVFWDLHDAIQQAFGFDDRQLWAFQESRTSPPFAAYVEEGCLSASAPDAAAVSLESWFGVGRETRCLYRYDFVAGYLLGVELGAVLDAEPGPVAGAGGAA